jgi:hypothetical protein
LLQRRAERAIVVSQKSDTSRGSPRSRAAKRGLLGTHNY